LGSVFPSGAAGELTSGTVLGARFHIIRHLNTGGMGAVYEAWDLELQEVLALKAIRPEIASDRAVIERFKEEVRQAHQITHPNICRVYDLFSHDFSSGDRIWFLTMQLLRGETLQECLRQQGPLSCSQALPLVRQMISGLNAAHQHGIVHRDFKSSNVIVIQEQGREARAVITDFGLASRATTAETNTGAFAKQGTPAYVAPEQWFDGIISPAADQYSLGVVICEILTGEHPTSVEHQDGSRLPAKLPPGRKLHPRWEAAIRRCLELNPKDRFASLDEILARIDPSLRTKRIARWVAVAMTALVLSILGILAFIGANQAPSLVGLKQITPSMDFSVSPRLSRDGKTIAYASDRAEPGNQDIWVQQVPDGTPRRVTTDPGTDTSPSISPDGRTLVFESSRSHPGIYATELDGAGDRLLVPGGHEPVFSPVDRSFLYWEGDEFGHRLRRKIYRYEFSTGKSTQLSPEMTDATSPVWNSDGRHLLFVGCKDPSGDIPSCEDWWVTTTSGGPARNTNAVALLKSQQFRSQDYFGGWQGNTLVFSALHDSFVGLWSIKIDPQSGKVRGMPRKLIAGDRRDFIISSSLVGDSLAYCQMNPAIHIWKIDHPTRRKHPQPYKITQDTEFDLAPRASQNGRWLSFARGSSDNPNLYLRDMVTATERMVVSRGTSKLASIPNESGTAIAYETSDAGVHSILLAGSDNIPRRLCTGCRNPTGWMPHDEALLYGDSAVSEVRMMRISSGEAKTILSFSDGSVRDAVWSAANHFIVFTVSGPESLGQVFAAKFPPGNNSPDNRWIQITDKAYYSRRPVWSDDGKTIFYLSDRDGFWCIWGERFDPAAGRATGKPIPIQHFHDMRLSPEELGGDLFNLSAAGDSLYLNLVESGGTIWLGKLAKSFVVPRVQ
jgi:serine/threonine protein kinase